MGIYSRDYYRNERRFGREPWLVSGCKWLVAINVIVFVLQLFRVEGVSVVTEWLELNPDLALHGQIWRFLTYAFCHDPSSPFHILFNMLFLYWLGTTLEQMYGTREFVLFYLVAAIVSGIAFTILGLIMRDLRPAVGASGAVMAVTMLFAMHFPRQRVLIFGLIPVEIRFLVLFYVIFDMLPVLQALRGTEPRDNVAHAAHLGGLAFGYAYYRLHWRLERFVNGFNSFVRLRLQSWKMRSGPVRIYDPSAEPRDENLEVKVDTILQKIVEHGEASLTEQERETLRRASERYKGQHGSR